MAKTRIGSDPLDDLVPTRAKQMRTPKANAKVKANPLPEALPSEDAPPETSHTPEWTANHPRVTFYCPRDLLGKVEQEIRRSGHSKSRVIVEALERHLKTS